MSVAYQENTYGKVANGTEQLPTGFVDFQGAQAKLAEFTPEALSIIAESDRLVTSWDADGVFWSEYNEHGDPIIGPKEQRELQRIDLHRRRIDRLLDGTGKSQLHILNTNREFPIIPSIMAHIDPHFSQGIWAGILEGGHTLAYRLRAEYLDQNSNHRIDSNGTITFADGAQARLVQDFGDGTYFFAENLLRAPHLRDTRIGQDNLSVADAREKLVQTLTDNIGQLGSQAWIPQGRLGMVTARKVTPQMVVTNGEDLSNIKKWSVPPGSPIMGLVKAALNLNSEAPEELPFEVKYYPFDGGLDVQFRGLDKRFGQQRLIMRLRSLGVVKPHEKMAIMHVGDSGSDDVAEVQEQLGYRSMVVAVGNSDPKLANIASIQADKPVRKGARQIMYNLGNMIGQIAKKGGEPPNGKDAEIKEKNPEGSLGDYILSYLGRDNPREGDIDLRNVIKNADLQTLSNIRGVLIRARNNGGRAFVFGNGGSMDNAKLIAGYLKGINIKARTPGDGTSYLQTTNKSGYPDIFVDALQEDGFTEKDIVIGISGSGDSENVLRAHDFAQTVRMKHIEQDVATLDKQYDIDVSWYELPPLKDEPESFEQKTEALAGFEASIAKAERDAQAAGDTEAQNLIKKIKGSRNVVSLGGRNGGKMLRLTSEGLTHLARTNVMEILEDENPHVMKFLIDSINSGRPLEDLLGNGLQLIDSLRKPETLSKLVDFAARMEQMIMTDKGRVIIVGNPFLNPSTTHADADWSRGLVNMLPVSGPEITLLAQNINDVTATLNDDGSRSVYMDRFAKIKLSPDDTVVFIGPSAEAARFELCMRRSEKKGAYTFVVGTDISGRKADIPIADSDVDIAATAVLHAVSRGVNDHIRNEMGWPARKMNRSEWPQEIIEWRDERIRGERKLTEEETKELENKLRSAGLLTQQQQIRFTYGNEYIVNDPTLLNPDLEEGYY